MNYLKARWRDTGLSVEAQHAPPSGATEFRIVMAEGQMYACQTSERPRLTQSHIGTKRPFSPRTFPSGFVTW
jgi:hypothetical protein